MEGWLSKQGERGPVKTFKKRWFVQQGDFLIYSKSKADPKLGQIDLTSALSCCKSDNIKDQKSFRFQINTPSRIWYLAAESSDVEEYWVKGINQIIKSQSSNTSKIQTHFVDLEDRLTVLECALELAAEKLNTTVGSLIVEAESKQQELPFHDEKRRSSSDFEPFVATVLYNYTAQQDFEMSIAHRENVTVLAKHPNGWWLGTKGDGQRGYFPSSYVSPNVK